MTLEVLVATMHQTDYTLLDSMSIQSSAVVVNQCDNNSVHVFSHNGYEITWINTTQRGLSKSRNMALSFSKGDVCIIADEDEVFLDGYSSMVEKEFENNSKADVLVFNFKRKNTSYSRKPNIDRKAPVYRNYASVSIAFRRIKILKNGIHFNELIGAGTKYGAGEECIFLRDCRKNGLIIYENHNYLCEVDFSSSTWFNGYDEKFYFDTGVYLAIMYGQLAKVFMLYFYLQSRRMSKLKGTVVIKKMLEGIAVYKKL